MSSGAEVVFNTIVPPGVVPFFEQLHDAGFTKRGGHLVCTYFDETCLDLVPAEQVEGCTAASTTTRTPTIRLARSCSSRLQQALPGQFHVHRRWGVLRHVPGPEVLGGRRARGRLARPGRRHRGLDHAKIAVGPGGPAEMVPGQHHVRMNMYIAQVRNGAIKTVKSLGVVDPDERAGRCRRSRRRAAG